jgi:hypothetical protein
MKEVWTARLLLDITGLRSMAYSHVFGVDNLPDSTGMASAAEHTDYSHDESVYHSSNEDSNESAEAFTTHQTGYTDEQQLSMFVIVAALNSVPCVCNSCLPALEVDILQFRDM